MGITEGVYHILLTDSPDPADVQATREGLEASNAAQGVPVDWVSLGVFLRDGRGAVVGGLVGGTYWGWLYVEYLWVDERLRGRGYGSRLLAQAEGEALRRGCHHAHLDTQDFQAVAFYQKRGYSLFGELADFPLGHRRLCLQKPLRPPAAG